MNKFIKIFMALPLIGLLTACGDEDELTNSIDFNWGFQSHDKNSVRYKFDYLTTEEQQLGALDFARTYLSMTTEKMRPFCLLLVDTLYITRGGATTKPEYHTNFRALVVSQLQDLDNAGKQERATNILRDMVLSKVTLNEELVTRFGAVSSRDNFVVVLGWSVVPKAVWAACGACLTQVRGGIPKNSTTPRWPMSMLITVGRQASILSQPSKPSVHSSLRRLAN